MAKTITTFLIDGTPQSVSIYTIGNRVCQMSVIPRTRLDILCGRTRRAERSAMYTERTK